jgi:hypothetical protein
MEFPFELRGFNYEMLAYKWPIFCWFSDNKHSTQQLLNVSRPLGKVHKQSEPNHLPTTGWNAVQRSGARRGDVAI